MMSFWEYEVFYTIEVPYEFSYTIEGLDEDF